MKGSYSSRYLETNPSQRVRKNHHFCRLCVDCGPGVVPALSPLLITTINCRSYDPYFKGGESLALGGWWRVCWGLTSVTKTVPGTQTPFRVVISDSHRQQVEGLRPQSQLIWPQSLLFFCCAKLFLSLNPHRLHVLPGCYNLGAMTRVFILTTPLIVRALWWLLDQRVREPSGYLQDYCFTRCTWAEIVHSFSLLLRSRPNDSRPLSLSGTQLELVQLQDSFLWEQ